MHRADPFMLDEEIAETDEAPLRPPPPAPPTPKPASPPAERTAQAPTPRPAEALSPAPAPAPAATPRPTPAPKSAPVVTPAKKAKRGRPKSTNPKRQITLRLDAEIIEHYKSQGRGWQTRINSALRKAAGL